MIFILVSSEHNYQAYNYNYITKKNYITTRKVQTCIQCHWFHTGIFYIQLDQLTVNFELPNLFKQIIWKFRKNLSLKIQEIP